MGVRWRSGEEGSKSCYHSILSTIHAISPTVLLYHVIQASLKAFPIIQIMAK
jgi:hypothetical protein